jgi:hypothetical protein
MGRDGTGRMGGYDGKRPGMTTQLIVDTEDEPGGPCCGVTIIMAAKTVDSYRFLHGIEKRMLKRWVSLPRETQIPWTPLASDTVHFESGVFSRPLLASTVRRYFAIHHDRHEPAIFYVLVHDPMTASSQLPPAARLLRILFDRLVFVTSDGERCGSQVLPTGAAYRCRLPLHTY